MYYILLLLFTVLYSTQVRPFPRWGCPCSRDTRLFHSTSWRIGLTPWLILPIGPRFGRNLYAELIQEGNSASLESYRGLGKARGTAACAGGALAESFNTDSDCVARVFDDHCGHIHIGPFAAGGILRAPFR